jgi:hypothetical protein
MMTFNECVLYCAGSRGLVAQFDRLTGSNLCMRGTPVDLMVDEATGRQREELVRFMAFVFECIWTRLPEEAFSG